MDTVEIIVIAGATIAGPILAIQAQKWIERATERRRARHAIFHPLMSNRATRLNDDFVRALNLIDLEFSPRKLFGKKDRAVINAWRSLFGEYQAGAGGDTEVALRAWSQRIDDKLVSMLSAMSSALGYQFSEEELRRGIYYPRGRVELEQSQLAVLHGFKKVLEGQLSIPMRVTEFPSSPELTAAQTTLAEQAARVYDDDAIRVRILSPEGDQPIPRQRNEKS
jgi:hypothetical protein